MSKLRTSNYRDNILFPIAYSLGIDPTLDLGKDHVRAWNSFVNTRVRQAWEFWPWPQLEITEERAYRTIWNATRIFFAGDELFYLPTFSYYKAIIDPPAGTAPTDTSYYEPIALADYYIELDQVGRKPIGELLGLYAGNPRGGGALPPFMPSLHYKPSEKGFDVWPIGSGLTAFAKYRLTPSQFTTEPYDPARTYQVGNLIYWTDGETWQAVVATVGNDPRVPGFWRKMPMPWIFEDYVTSAVAADACDDLQSAQLFQAAADDSLARQANLLMEQGQKFHYQHARRWGYWSYAAYPSNAWTSSPPWATSSDTTTLTDQDDWYVPEVPAQLPILETGITPLIIGQTWCDVVFATPKDNANYHFAELHVEYSGTGGPLYLQADFVVDRETTGFRVLLNGAPDTNEYALHWRVTT